MDLDGELEELLELANPHHHAPPLGAAPHAGSMTPAQSLLALAETLQHLDATLERLCQCAYHVPSLEERAEEDAERACAEVLG